MDAIKKVQTALPAAYVPLNARFRL